MSEELNGLSVRYLGAGKVCKRSHNGTVSTRQLFVAGDTWNGRVWRV